MSTRSIIARIGKNEGEFSGVYNHSDGMPRTQGPVLFQIIASEFKGDLKSALRYLIDEHPAGWSSIIPEHRRCFCHPENANDPEFREREPALACTFTLKDSDAQWLYVFDKENMRLYVRDIRHDSEHIVELAAAEEPDWTVIECGENFERCGHYAWVHGLLPHTSDLSTRTWLEFQPLEFRNAIAFVVKGKRYKATGSGGSSDFYNSHPGFARTKPFPTQTWVSDVVAPNGRRAQMVVASISPDGKYTPYPGVTWIYPPTKDNPKETEVR